MGAGTGEAGRSAVIFLIAATSKAIVTGAIPGPDALGGDSLDVRHPLVALPYGPVAQKNYALPLSALKARVIDGLPAIW